MIFGPILHVGWASASCDPDRDELLRAAPPERPPAGGEDQPRHLVGAVARTQALVQRAVLGVHGDDLRPRGRLGPGHDGGACDQGLLVGEGQSPTGPERGQGDGQPGEAHHGVEHDVAAGAPPRRGLRARPGPRSPWAPSPTAPAPAWRRRWPRRRVAAPAPGRPARRPSATWPGRPTLNRSGSAAITSTAWVPIDPVDPTRLTLTGRPPTSGPCSVSRSAPGPHPRWSTRTR